MKEINIFVLVLCCVYLIKNCASILMGAFSDEPEPIKFTVIDKIFLYFSISYIITYIILNV